MAGLNKIIVVMLKGYRLFVSPSYASCCRFIPSCSSYALSAYQSFGFFRATYLVFKRLACCHPFGSTGLDELPKREDNYE